MQALYWSLGQTLNFTKDSVCQLDHWQPDQLEESLPPVFYLLSSVTSSCKNAIQTINFPYKCLEKCVEVYITKLFKNLCYCKKCEDTELRHKCDCSKFSKKGVAPVLFLSTHVCHSRDKGLQSKKVPHTLISEFLKLRAINCAHASEC